MKFKLRTSRTHYDDDAEIEELKRLGFVFRQGDLKTFRERVVFLICNEPEIEINTIEELLSFVDYPLIINGSSLEIYNDHRE